MKHLVLGAVLAVAVLPQPAHAIVLSDAMPQTCAQPDRAVVTMPCAKQPAQLQTLHTSLLRAFVPMSCRPVGVRFQLAGIPVAPGRGAGLIASAIFHTPSQHAHLEQTCQPTGW